MPPADAAVGSVGSKSASGKTRKRKTLRRALMGIKREEEKEESARVCAADEGGRKEGRRRRRAARAFDSSRGKHPPVPGVTDVRTTRPYLFVTREKIKFSFPWVLSPDTVASTHPASLRALASLRHLFFSFFSFLVFLRFSSSKFS